MSSLLKEILLRVFCCGILCSFALILSNGKETVRLCCACFTVAVLLMPYKNKVPDMGELWEIEDRLAADIEQEILSSEREREQTVSETLSGYFESIIGVPTEVIYSENAVKKVTVHGEENEEIRKILTGYGFTKEQISFEGGSE